MRKFNLYTVADARDFVAAQIPPENQDDYKYKKLYRKEKDTLVLNKKSFENLKDEIDTPLIVTGRIRKRQLRYKDYEDYNELVDKKNKKKIYGKATLPFHTYKRYDVRKDANRHIYGYAWIGDNKFLKVTTLNPLWILLPLLIILICVLLHGCPSDFNPVDVFDNPSDITDDKPTEQAEASPLCYYVPFNEKTTLTKDKPIVKLLNVKENEGNYYISYQVFINGKPQKLVVKDGMFYLSDGNEENSVSSTGLLAPNKQILLNLWEGLDEGSYEVTVVATDYDYSVINDITNNSGLYSNKKKGELQDKATKPVTHTLKTTLIVNK